MKRSRCPLLVAVAALALAATADAAPTHLGVSYSAWDKDLNDPATAAQLDQSLDDLVHTGATWVALNVFEFQDTLLSTTIAADPSLWSTDDLSVARAVQEMHDRGLKVLLKPMVDVKSPNYPWRGWIPPSPGWFAGYTGFISGWAAKADALGVDAFSIGCEFRTIVQNTPPEDLRDAVSAMIGAIRAAGYAGPLTYSANHDSYQDVPFWDLMDFVGIDAYFPSGLGTADPTLAQLEDAWAGIADDIEAWLYDPGLDLPDKVVFTEIGCSKWDGCSELPNEAQPSATLDTAEQADFYLASLRETWSREWMDGYFWWIWDTEPGGADWNNFRFAGYPAQGVVRGFYIPEPTTLALLGLGALALARRRRRRR